MPTKTKAHYSTVKVNTSKLGAWAWCPTCCYLGPIRPTQQQASVDAAGHADAVARLDQA